MEIRNLNLKKSFNFLDQPSDQDDFDNQSQPRSSFKHVVVNHRSYEKIVWTHEFRFTDSILAYFKPTSITLPHYFEIWSPSVAKYSNWTSIEAYLTDI